MYLYELDYQNYQCPASAFSVCKKKITLLSLSMEKEENSIKKRLQRLAFLLLSKGRFWIYYVKDEEADLIVHTSYVMGASIKFPFMQKADIHIGPCHTIPAYRRQGIYKNVLQSIHIDNHHSFQKAYMIVSEKNTPSIKGIEAAGFQRIGTVKRIKLFKQYRRIENG